MNFKAVFNTPVTEYQIRILHVQTRIQQIVQIDARN